MGKRLERFGEVRIIDETNGHDVLQDSNDNSMLDMLIGYSCI